MAGGPLNGARSPNGKENPVIVSTALQIASDMLQWFTGMTCLYDPYFVQDDNRVALPIAFFQITKIRETWANETSDQRILLYEPQEDLTAKEMSSTMREGAVQAVVDNTVRKPKMYAIEAVVPYKPVGRFMKDGIANVTGVLSSFVELFGSSSINTLSGYMSEVTHLAETASTVVDALGKLPEMDGVSYINMNSLEAMAESCRTLCMKMWTGYDYKFVSIIGMEKEKMPKEDDVFRVTLSVKEHPILSISKPKAPVANKVDRTLVASIISTTQQALSYSAKVLTGVASASGMVGIDKE